MPIIFPHWRFHRREFARVEAFKPDLVHLMSPGVLAYFGQLWARRHGCGVVASYETDIVRYMHYYGFARFEPLLWRYLRWLFNNCQQTYVPSRVTMEQLIKGGIHDVRVFERGVDCAQFHPGKRSEAVGGMGSRHCRCAGAVCRQDLEGKEFGRIIECVHSAGGKAS